MNSVVILQIILIIIIRCEKINNINNKPLIIYAMSKHFNNNNGIFMNTIENFEKINFNSSLHINGTELNANKSDIFQIKYSLNEKLIFWTKRDYNLVENYFSLSMISFNLSEYNGGNDSNIVCNKTELLRTSHLFSFTIDWIHSLIYQINQFSVLVSQISQINSTYPVINAKQRIDSFALNPKDSLIFWSEYYPLSKMSVIKKANQDGSQPQLILNFTSAFIFEITIDFVNEKLFWFNFGEFNQSFMSIDFNGNNFNIVYKLIDLKIDYSLFAFDIFDDYLYFTCEVSNYIIEKMCKFRVNNSKIYESIDLKDGDYSLKYDYRIMDSSLQPNTHNRCQNSECSHLCLPINGSHYRCICPSNTNITFCKERINHINSTYVEELETMGTKIMGSYLIEIVSVMTLLFIIITIALIFIICYILKKNKMKVMTLKSEIKIKESNVDNIYDEAHYNAYEAVVYDQYLEIELNGNEDYDDIQVPDDIYVSQYMEITAKI